jgi:hypothetical protein
MQEVARAGLLRGMNRRDGGRDVRLRLLHIGAYCPYVADHRLHLGEIQRDLLYVGVGLPGNRCTVRLLPSTSAVTTGSAAGYMLDHD